MSGVFWTMATPVTAEVVGLQDLASALSLVWTLGTVIPTTCILHLSTSHVLISLFSRGSHRPSIAAKCHCRGKNRSRYISTNHLLCRSHDIRWWTHINCTVDPLNRRLIIPRAQKFGCKTRDMGRRAGFGCGKRLEYGPAIFNSIAY